MKKITIIAAIICLTAGLTGCFKQTYISKTIVGNGGSGNHKTLKMVTENYRDEMSDDDLGDIITEGDFAECNPDNILKFEGCYRGLDFVTLVFDISSPIDDEVIKRAIDENYEISLYNVGVVYSVKGGKKYVTYIYEKNYLTQHGKMVQYDTTGSDYFFPTEDSKRKSYYSVHVKERKDKSYNIYVCHCTETSIIEESYWTDYTYDCTSQVYDNETDTWETAQEKDCKTNNMPLE